VTVNTSGPVDSLRSDAGGRFTFRFTPDTGAVYLVSARWEGIEYFGPPVTATVRDSAPDITVPVFDTSSTAPVRLAARHLIVSNLTPEGVRDVVDLFVLDNTGTETRIAVDATHPSWQSQLPAFAVNGRPGNSAFAVQSIRLAGQTFGLFAAIPPGQRDIEIDYQIPPATREFAVPVDESAPVSNVISDDPTMEVIGPFVRSDTTIGGKLYARWEGKLIAGSPLVLRFHSASNPRWIVPLLVAVMALALVAATFAASRRRTS